SCLLYDGGGGRAVARWPSLRPRRYGGEPQGWPSGPLLTMIFLGRPRQTWAVERGGIPPAIRQRPPPVVLPDYATGDIASAVALVCRSPSCIAPANVRYASDQAAFTSGVNAEPSPCSSVQSRAAPTGP